MNLPVPLAQLIQLFDVPGVHALVLMSSYARGEARSYSDSDVVRFTDWTHLPGAGCYLMDGHLVVVSDVTPGQVERWFSEPQVATDTIMYIRSAQSLLDRDGSCAGHLAV